MPTLLGELDANRGSADPHSLNYNDEGSPIVHHVTGLVLVAFGRAVYELQHLFRFHRLPSSCERDA